MYARARKKERKFESQYRSSARFDSCRLSCATHFEIESSLRLPLRSAAKQMCRIWQQTCCHLFAAAAKAKAEANSPIRLRCSTTITLTQSIRFGSSSIVRAALTHRRRPEVDTHNTTQRKLSGTRLVLPLPLRNVSVLTFARNWSVWGKRFRRKWLAARRMRMIDAVLALAGAHSELGDANLHRSHEASKEREREIAKLR